MLSAIVSGLGSYLDAVLPFGTLILHMLNFAVSFALISVLFGANYKVLPDVELSWRAVLVGAMVTELLFNVGKFLIGLDFGEFRVSRRADCATIVAEVATRRAREEVGGDMLYWRSFTAVAFALLAGAASAATVKYHAALTAGAEVPPTNSTGTGEANATLDTATHELTYDVTFSGFSSDVTAAHIHGPAATGKNAGVLVPLGNAPKSPVHGSATLTAEQEQQLAAGDLYVNVHTKNHPSGAIRGQLAKEP